jgi:hypothetical protein
MERSLNEKRTHRVYGQEFKDQAVEMVILSGKSQTQVAPETWGTGPRFRHVLRVSEALSGQGH